MQKESLKKIKLPDKPGVYFFLGPPKRSEGGKNGKRILYIGKATSLRDRVKSYFGRDLIKTRGLIILDMVFQAIKIDWQETGSVLEAIILEANLIKKNQPYYNTKEKDDKSFNVVCITKEPFPKILVFRERNLKTSFQEENSKFQAKYGPFTNGPQLKEAMNIIRHIFPYLDAKSSQPNSFEFYRQIGLAPEVGTDEAKIAYGKNIKNLKLFFEGKKKIVVSNFKKEMMIFAKNKEFERANEMKQRIFSINHINDVALLKSESRKQENFQPCALPGVPGGTLAHENFLVSVIRIEAYDIAHLAGKNMVGVMTVLKDGEIEKSEYKKFKIRTQNNANDIGALTEVLERRLAHKEWTYPSLIVVDGGMAQINVTRKILSRSNLDIPVVAVVKDQHHKPKDILGDNPRHGGASNFATKYKKEILLANSEAHRFAIAYHKNLRNRNFLI